MPAFFPSDFGGICMESKSMELLAPVGSMEALKAAVQNGADAVYLGGKTFSARQYAQNFEVSELKEAVKYAHFYGVKVYIAVNTLVDNKEFPQLFQHLFDLHLCNVDAIIIQDLGVASVVRKILPEMELHASTQMTIHNGPGARFLEDIGFSRVVLAREVSIENISRIGKVSSIPLEVFIHGALCVSYSGQCLMSSMIGGRSGNRGRCAQPCRLLYTLVNSSGKEIQQGHLLSPKDLNMIAHLSLLEEAGVVSLKVEGRMKRAEYVATVIRNYRKALELLEKQHNEGDEFNFTQAKKELSQIFNRDFTSGYYLKKPGKHLMSYQRPNNRGLRLGRVVSYNWDEREVTIHLEETLSVGDGYEIWVTKGGRIAGEIQHLKQDGKQVERAASGSQVTFKISKGTPRAGDRIFKTMDLALMEKARASFLLPQVQRRVPLSFSITVQEGQPLMVDAWDNQDNKVHILGDVIIKKAEKHAASHDIVKKQLARLGNTKFCLHELLLFGQEGMMVPLSELNNIRRRIVEKLEELRINKHAKMSLRKEVYEKRVQDLLKTSTEKKEKIALNSPKVAVTIGDMASLDAALAGGSKIIYFGGDYYRGREGIRSEHFIDVVQACHKAGAQAVLIVPRIFHEEITQIVTEYCLLGAKAGVDSFLVGNPGGLQLLKELAIEKVSIDYTFNVFNDYSISFLKDLGIKKITLSPEMTLEQISGINCPKDIELECIVHGSLPLMITEHCIIGNILGEGNRSYGCQVPCKKDKYGLKDRMNMVFPIETDEQCRTHIYNPKTLSMHDRMLALLRLGINTIRIEAKKENAMWVKNVVKIYCEELKRFKQMNKNYKPNEEHKIILQKLSPAGFTTGHYYRGVE